jgi:hypothetical protein
MAGRALVLLFLLTALLRADDEKDWSEPVNGLRGRLIIPEHQEVSADPFLKVYLELQNIENLLGSRSLKSAGA